MLQSSTSDSLGQRRFGPTPMSVTRLCVGCAQLGDMPETFAFSVSEQRALETLREAFRSPINFLDTAAAYGDGESERRIGVVLRELGGVPDDYVVATKADRDLATNDFSGDQIKRSIERSQRLLGMARLPIVYLHDPEHTTYEDIMSPGGAVDVLVKYRSEGVIQHLGIAGGPVDLMMRYVETGVFEALITHNRYTLLNRSAEPLLELAAARGLAVVNAAPYGSGILAKGPDAYARYAYQDAPPDMVEAVRAMADMCKRYNVPLAAAALQFSLRDQRITSTIVGMSRPERISQTVELAQHPIPHELWSELETISVSHVDPEAGRW